jgi:uncharacterized membrane protein YgdD (TMEM256/DUF423 family)
MFIKISAFLLAVGVCLGAFGAHALKARFGEYELGIWNTATLYLFIHCLALLVITIAQKAGVLTTESVIVTQYCFLFGTLIFSGSLYALTLTGIKMLGAITPIGGTLFIAGWVLFALRS